MTTNNLEISHISPVNIRYDSTRTNSLYFAEVTVYYTPNRHSGFDELNLGFSKTIEVILNGPGKTKALKKVRDRLGICKTPGWASQRKNYHHLEIASESEE